MNSLSFIGECLFVVLILFSLACGQAIIAGNVVKDKEYLNITDFGTICYWDSADPLLGKEITILPCKKEKVDNLGVRWENARDIQRFEIVCTSPISQNIINSMKIEYWHNSWPEETPRMPSYEDNEDDLWQGEWITAKTNIERRGDRIIFTFNLC